MSHDSSLDHHGEMREKTIESNSYVWKIINLHILTFSKVMKMLGFHFSGYEVVICLSFGQEMGY